MITLAEYIKKSDCSPSKIANLAGCSSRSVKTALENETSQSAKLIKWCNENGITIKADKVLRTGTKKAKEKPLQRLTPHQALAQHINETRRGFIRLAHHEIEAFKKMLPSTVTLTAVEGNKYRTTFKFETQGGKYIEECIDI